MKLFARSKTKTHEFLRATSSFLEYLIWLVSNKKRIKKIETNKINHLIVVLINQEKGNVGGDFCTLGVINYFHTLYPQIKISILSDRLTINQFGKIPGINFIDFEKLNSTLPKKEGETQAAILLKTHKLDLSKINSVDYIVGKTTPAILKFSRLNDKISLNRKVYTHPRMHMVNLRFAMLEALGFQFKEKKLNFHFTKNEERRVSSYLRKNKIKKFIILHPGGKYIVASLEKGKWPPHLWPFKNYAAVADYFSKKGYSVLVTGSSSEKILAKKIQDYAKHPLINCCGRLSIRETGTLLKKSKLLIATDTSIVHIAYQVGAKILELMGPSLPEIVGAWPIDDPKHKILVDKGPLSRSMKKVESPKGVIPLGEITTKEVIFEAEKLLSYS